MPNQIPIIADQLSGYPTFAACDRDDLEELAAVSDEFGVPAQWSFLQQGTPADDLYIITDGTVRVFRDRVPIAELGPGEIVGEMAFFGDRQRQATVSSVSRFRAVRIDYRELAGVLDRSPQLAAVVRSVCTARQPTG